MLRSDSGDPEVNAGDGSAVCCQPFPQRSLPDGIVAHQVFHQSNPFSAFQEIVLQVHHDYQQQL